MATKKPTKKPTNEPEIQAKPIEEMTALDAIRVLVTKPLARKVGCNSKTHRCEVCFADGTKHWTEGGTPTVCVNVEEKAVELLLALYEENRNFLDEILNGSVPSNDQEPTVQSSQNDTKPQLLEYQSTINFMKRRGYDHCYMCGASLKEGD